VNPAQLYFDDGTPNGLPFVVNSLVVDFHNGPEVLALDDGGFIVAWQAFGQDSPPVPPAPNGVFTQRFDANGTPVGGETLVNTTVLGEQGAPVLASYGAGGYVVAWHSRGLGPSDTYDIYAQRYLADGTPDGGEFLVNTDVTGEESTPAIVGLADGGFVITWSSHHVGPEADVYLQRYDSSGNPVGGETLVNTTIANIQTAPSVAALEDGGYVVSWYQLGGVTGVYAQRFDASGAPVGGEFFVAGAGSEPTALGLSDGGFAITYTLEIASGNTDVYMQRYFADGTLNGPAFLVNTREQNGFQFSSDVAELSGGRLVAGWYQILNGAWDVFGRIIGSTPEDTPIPLAIDAQLVDTDGSETLSPVTITGVLTGAHFNAGMDMGGGTWVIDVVDLPGLELTPPLDFFGAMTITVSATSTEASNGDAETSSVVLTMFVHPVNDLPFADDDDVTTDKNVPVTLTNAALIADDGDPDGDPLTVVGAGNGTFGTTSVTTSGDVIYTPNMGFDGTDSFIYTITDGEGGTSTGTVFVTVLDTNQQPIADDDTATTLDDVPVTIAVLANDTDADMDPLTVIAEDAPNGTTSVGTDGTVIYTPDDGFVGTDQFVYTVSDNNGGLATAAVTVTVTAGHSPIAGEGWYGMRINATLTGDPGSGVLFNEYDADGDPMTVIAATQPLHGTLTMNTDGSFVYRPTTGFEGTDFYNYTITDGNHGLTDAATIHIHVGTRTVGDGGPNLINGGPGVDDIDAFNGDDVVNGGDGPDFINGQGGADTLNGDGGDDYINGNNSSPTTTDIMNGGDGNDVLYGNSHADTMTGGNGHDRFKFYMTPTMGEFGTNNIITDFTTGPVSGGGEVANADMIDLRDVLIDYNGTPSEYITLQEVGGDTRVNVDPDGTGSMFSAATLVVLQGVTGLDLPTLIADGNVMLPNQDPHMS